MTEQLTEAEHEPCTIVQGEIPDWLEGETFVDVRPCVFVYLCLAIYLSIFNNTTGFETSRSLLAMIANSVVQSSTQTILIMLFSSYATQQCLILTSLFANCDKIFGDTC